MKKNLNKEFFDDLNPEIEKFVNKSVEISDRIEEILKKKNISQKELADKLGKSESEISKWLSGTHNFTIKSIAKIESVLEDEIMKICCETKENSINNLWIKTEYTFNSNTFLNLTNIDELLVSFLDYSYSNKNTKHSFTNYTEISSKNLISINNDETKNAA